MSFDRIKGQEVAVNYLRKTLIRQHIPPTFIFSGTAGTGRLLTAMTFAKALNCLRLSDDACDTCKSCVAIDGGVHPNVSVIGIGNYSIGIDEIRNISESSFMPINNKYKVNIIDNADKSTMEAFNSMLKFFEEPPERTVNILIAENVSLIPETVKSRAVELKFKPLSNEIVMEILLAQGIAKQSAEVIAHLSKGSLERTKLYTEDAALEKREQFLKGFLKFLRGEGSVGEVVALWKAFHKRDIDRENVNLLFENIADIIDDILIVTIMKDTERLVNIDFLGHLADGFFAFSRGKLEQIYEVVTNGKMALLTNANPMYIMLSVLFTIREVVDEHF